MFKNYKSKSALSGIFCILIMASLVEDPTFSIVLLVIAGSLGAVLGFDALRQNKA